MRKLKEIERLTPFLAYKIWGTKELTIMKTGSACSGDPLGESLEISCLNLAASKLECGTSLDKVIDEKDLPYLVKIIDTSDNLSIQVHPEDEYAKRVENSMGKTECWLILEAKENEGIYLGLKDGVTKTELEASIRSSQDVSLLLNFYEVKTGDFFYVPAGSIHAIGKGIRLLEVQQNSGVTYRVWDWNRLDDKGLSRELHIEKALDVIEFDSVKNNKEYFKFKNKLFDNLNDREIVNHRDFRASLYKAGTKGLKLEVGSTRHGSILNLSGELRINRGDEEIILKQYESILLPFFSNNNLDVTSTDNSSFLFVS